MDAVDIIILAAAGVGLVAFVVLAILILRQGRSIKELEDRIGPPVPPAAAPSLERVRAVTAGTSAVVAAPEAAPGQAPAARAPGSGDQAAAAGAAAAGAAAAGAPSAGAPSAGAATGDDVGAGTQRARAERRQGAAPGTQQRREPASDESSGRGFLIGIAVVLAVAIIGVGGWWFFLRGDSSASTAATGTQTTATVADTGEVPEDVPPVANKAAYTVAVLNASNITGAAANKVAPRVQADGYTLGVVDNATKQDLTASEVQYVKGRKEVAWNLAKDLGITTAVEVNQLTKGRIGTADVVVVVGKDLAK